MNEIQDLVGVSEWSAPLVAALVIWSLFWKGMALWFAARKRDKFWFVIILLVNTLGILEVVYLLVLRNQKMKKLIKDVQK
jgi:hypothetical protein